MNTLYEIFQVSEDASQDEIKSAYEKLIRKYEEEPQTEKVLQKLQRTKIAYEILSNVEKRKRYDLDLANKRAEELFKNVEQKQESEQILNLQNNEIKQKDKEENKDKKFEEQISAEAQKLRIQNEIDRQINLAIEKQRIDQERVKLYEKEVKKQAKKQIKKEKKLAKKNAQNEREMQIQAYGKYLESQGYKVRYPWTWPRIKRLMIALTSVIISCIVLWQIPFIRENLIKFYEENFIIKILVDIVLSIFKGIASIFNH